MDLDNRDSDHLFIKQYDDFGSPRIKNGYILSYVSKRLRDDKEIVSLAIKKYSLCF